MDWSEACALHDHVAPLVEQGWRLMELEQRAGGKWVGTLYQAGTKLRVVVTRWEGFPAWFERYRADPPRRLEGYDHVRISLFAGDGRDEPDGTGRGPILWSER